MLLALRIIGEAFVGFASRIGVIVLLTGALLATFGAAISSAKDPYEGKTYAEASAKLSENGYSAVISTVVGDQLSTDDCIVTSSRKATFAPDNFDHNKSYLLALNCSAPLAHAGKPGNSLTSPEGRQEKGIENRAERYNSNLENCTKDLERCKRFCDAYAGKCSQDVLALF